MLEADEQARGHAPGHVPEHAPGQPRGQRDDIAWFRAASPYIRAHRDATVVVAVPGRHLLADAPGPLATLCHDLALLCHLGLRVVLCFGLRAQVDAALGDGAVVDGRRVTDDRALAAILEAAGRARHTLETRLSAGLPDRHGADDELTVSSSNLVRARPFGVHDGVDFLHSGAVREVRHGPLRALLDAGHLVLQAPLGHSPTGDVFNIPVDEIAAEIAIALRAEKLVHLVDALPRAADGSAARQLSAQDIGDAAARATADERPDLARLLQRSQRACLQGVGRVHLLDAADPDALLAELFTRDGSGTLLTAGRYDALRHATIEDVGGIMRLIEPLQDDGTLASRSREQLELDIERFTVDVRDGLVLACGAAFDLDDGDSVEIGCIATHPGYRGEGRADAVLARLERAARERGRDRALLLSTRTGHWFLERGYREASLDALPPTRRDRYNRSRNSKVYLKLLR